MSLPLLLQFDLLALALSGIRRLSFCCDYRWIASVLLNGTQQCCCRCCLCYCICYYFNLFLLQLQLNFLSLLLPSCIDYVSVRQCWTLLLLLLALTVVVVADVVVGGDIGVTGEVFVRVVVFFSPSFCCYCRCCYCCCWLLLLLLQLVVAADVGIAKQLP